jgi:type IV secretory pathway TrbF-like protein
MGHARYIGEFHLAIIPPETREQLELNPLGVYLAFFDFDEKRQ